MVYKKPFPKQHKKRGFFFYVTRYFLFISVTLFFFAGASAIMHWSDRPPTCANSQTCTSDLRENIENNAIAFFEGKKIPAPNVDTTSVSYAPVLGASTPTGDKHIYVDLAAQTLYAYQGKSLFLKTLISSGKWGRTPVGNFNIWEKLVSTRMAGGEGADAYDLPNVPYVMYFYHDFGLHGAYWHDNFGHTMSHGCVNMRTVDAKTLFSWTDGPQGDKLGTPVSVCDQIVNMQCIQNNPIN